MENERKYLSDVMTSKEQQEIIEGEFIKLLCCGTGAGKSYFLINHLVDRLTYEGRNILILANRTALKIQYKKDLEEADTVNFGKRVEIVCYQSLINYTVEELMFEYDYIICDESHFMLADATYNPDTDYILNLLLGYYKENKDGLLFVTATPFELRAFLHIHNVSEEHGNLKIYDYDKYLNWYDRIDLICTSKKYMDIAKLVPDDEKALIFIKAKNKMPDICEKLGNASFIHTQWKEDNKKDTEMAEKIEELIKKKTFDTKYLITNATLDNGINIIDDKLKTIIIDNIYDLVSVIQMIGRKRFLTDNPEDRIKVYLISNIGTIINDLNHYKSFIKMYTDFMEDETERKLNFLKLHGAYIQEVREKNKSKKSKLLLPIDYELNILTGKISYIVRKTLVAKASYLVEYYQSLINMMIEDDDTVQATINIHRLADINYNRAKLLARQYNKNIDEIVVDAGSHLKTLLRLSETEKALNDELIPYLESMLDVELYGDIKEEFRKVMGDKYGLKRKPTEATPSKLKINKLINKYGYEIIEPNPRRINKKLTKYWLIIKK